MQPAPHRRTDRTQPRKRAGSSAWAAALLAAGLSLLPATVSAQSGPPTNLQTGDAPISPLLTVRSEEVFRKSLYGQRIENDYKAQLAVLAADNRRIEAELTAEEQDLSERRAEMEQQAFADLARAFDTKVREIRRERDQALTEANRKHEQAQSRFWTDIQPILGMALHESGAAAILEQQSVIASAQAIDITDHIVARIDATLADGSTLAPADAGPDPADDMGPAIAPDAARQSAPAAGQP
ncbi:OmpH family outer membrane protein [Chachezhania sediminis]|uniref:OmpH family outer membrane protein n=1 Tax=Chachezhania sediminis TaxID=2599291 RepID=UPI00131DCFC2|nr:OmpH family outer membrane protein [Chachezhania sediminis]